jgi:hypothetical protein
MRVIINLKNKEIGIVRNKKAFFISFTGCVNYLWYDNWRVYIHKRYRLFVILGYQILNGLNGPKGN